MFRTFPGGVQIICILFGSWVIGFRKMFFIAHINRILYLDFLFDFTLVDEIFFIVQHWAKNKSCLVWIYLSLVKILDQSSHSSIWNLMRNCVKLTFFEAFLDYEDDILWHILYSLCCSQCQELSKTDFKLSVAQLVLEL